MIIKTKDREKKKRERERKRERKKLGKASVTELREKEIKKK